MVPSTIKDDLLILFPGALGDFICLRPSLLALRERTGGRVAVASHPGFFPLLPAAQYETMSIDCREIGDLFAAGPLHGGTREYITGFRRTISWTGHGNPLFAERLRTATGGEVIVHPFRAMERDEHAVEYYARCACVEPVLQGFQADKRAGCWAADFWSSHDLGDRTLAIHPGSGGRAKNWRGMAEIAIWWREERHGKVLSIIGPAELERTIDLPADALAENQPLDFVAALLRRSHLYLGNDSGISHLAALAGARTITLFGPTEPRNWRPLGPAVRVLHAPTPCDRCGPDIFCTHRLRVEAVAREISRLPPLESQRRSAEIR